MHRSRPRNSRVQRIPRALAGAALPLILVSAGCSFSDDSAGPSTPEPAQESSSSPTVAPAKYDNLPEACAAIPQDTVKTLVKKVKEPTGDAVKSNDTSLNSGCSWTGLDGYQWRWLAVSFKRYDSDPAIGAGDKRADEFYTKQLGLVEQTEGARGMKTSNPAGLGEEATTFAYETTKEKQDYREQAVVVREANVVITLNYNGAGFEGAKQPQAADMLKDAESAAEQAVSAVE